MGRGAAGVHGIHLQQGDTVVGMQLRSQGDYMLLVTEKGIGKRVLSDEFSVQRRGGKGHFCYKPSDRTGLLVGFKAVDEENDVMLITAEGIVIRTPVSGISVYSRYAAGVKLMKTEASVASVAKVRDQDPAGDDTDAAVTAVEENAAEEEIMEEDIPEEDIIEEHIMEENIPEEDIREDDSTGDDSIE